MARESLDIPNDIQKVRLRFEQWRNAHAGRLQIPERLWAAAVELAREHGVFHTAKALRLKYGKLLCGSVTNALKLRKSISKRHRLLRAL
jgi:hypothetical protein